MEIESYKYVDEEVKLTNLHFANQQRNWELRTIGIFKHKASYNQEFDTMLDHYSWTEVAYIYLLGRLHTLAQMSFFLKNNFSKPKNIHTQKKHLLHLLILAIFVPLQHHIF